MRTGVAQKLSEEKTQRLTVESQECFAESDELQARIKANLEGLGYGE